MSVKLQLAPASEAAGPQVFSFVSGPPASRVGAADAVLQLFAPDPARAGGRVAKRKSSRVLLLRPSERDGAGAEAVFTGENFGGRAKRFAAQQHAVSVYDPATGRVTLVPVPHYFQLHQHIRGLRPKTGAAREADLARDGADGVALTSEQRADRKRELVESFGSRKKKRKMRSDAANRVDITAHNSVGAVAEALQTSTRGAADAALAAAAEAEATGAAGDAGLERIRQVMLPPRDPAAGEPSGSYPVHGLVPRDEWDDTDYKPFVRMAKKPSLIAREGADLPGFVRNRLQWLGGPGSRDPETGDARDTRPAARCLAHLTYLVRFYAVHLKAARGKAGAAVPLAEDLSAVGCPEHVSDRLVAWFAERQVGGRYKLSPLLQNKLRCYICVLALHASDFAIDYAAVTEMARDLGITVSSCISFFREVGAKAHGKGKERVVRLAAPLVLPALRKRARAS